MSASLCSKKGVQHSARNEIATGKEVPEGEVTTSEEAPESEHGKSEAASTANNDYNI